MIDSDEEREKIRESWEAVVKLRSFRHTVPLIKGTHVSLGYSIPDNFWNFPFFLAYAVLDDVLSVLQDEGLFNSGTWQLSKKMKASKSKINWLDYEFIDRGRDARNDLSHKGVFISVEESFAYVEGIERELQNWGILIEK